MIFATGGIYRLPDSSIDLFIFTPKKQMQNKEISGLASTKK